MMASRSASGSSTKPTSRLMLRHQRQDRRAGSRRSAPAGARSRRRDRRRWTTGWPAATRAAPCRAGRRRRRWRRAGRESRARGCASTSTSCRTRSRCQSSAVVAFARRRRACRAAPARMPFVSKICLTSLPLAADRTPPSAPKSFRPFHGAGLWLAVIWMPPAALSWRTARPHVGVGATPRSWTSQPRDASPARTAWRSIEPAGPRSRDRTTRPPLQVGAQRLRERQGGAGRQAPRRRCRGCPRRSTIRSLVAVAMCILGKIGKILKIDPVGCR